MTDGMQGGPCPLCNNVKEATDTPSSSWEVSQGVKSKRDAAGGNVKWYSCYRKQYGSSSKVI